MAGKKPRKPHSLKPVEATPLSGPTFSESTLEKNVSPTPKADQIERELLKTRRPPSLEHLSTYSQSARRLMWVAVIALSIVVCAMWSWSIYFQLSSIKWQQAPEKALLENTKVNWQKAFSDQNAGRLNVDKQINDLKANLTKILSGFAASSSTSTSTPAITTTTP